MIGENAKTSFAPAQAYLRGERRRPSMRAFLVRRATRFACFDQVSGSM